MHKPVAFFVPAGILALLTSPGILLLAEARGHFFPNNLPLIGMFGVTVALGAFGRRPLWLVSFLAVPAGVMLGLAAISLTQHAVATPWGDSLMNRDAKPKISSYLQSLQSARRIDLAMLERGVDAARVGQPLTAPEGGLLVPKNLGDSGFDSGVQTSLRFVAAPSGTSVREAWEEALVEQRKLSSIDAEQAEFRPTARLTDWWRMAAELGAMGLLLVFIANVAASLSRKIVGAAP